MALLAIDTNDAALLGRTLDTGETIDTALARLSAAHPAPLQALRAQAGKWPTGWADLAARTAEAQAATQLGVQLAAEYETLIVCGIGGSALGTQAVYAALDRPGNPLRQVIVLDNIDPLLISRLLHSIDPSSCAINVISKSGETIETMAGFLYLEEQFLQQGMSRERFDARVVATTSQTHGLLRTLADERGWRTLPVPEDVGGRFSVLTPVGLLPLAFAGVDIPALLQGARDYQQHLADAPTLENEAWRLAAIHYLTDAHAGHNISVQYIYADPLVLLGDWWRQLWAESLAKETALDGTPSRMCHTPVVARGATDQHSQNQLFFDGPDDKLYGIISAETWLEDMELHIPASPLLDSLRYASGHTFGELMQASRDGVMAALKAALRPVYEINLPRIGAAEIGAYLQLWMLATAFAGQLYNVNPFDQPGVEKSKRFTRQRLAVSDA